MKKNVPITQRAEVKTNSKNKVEEPLLNVGPAGVYGNNETRKIPAPAKQLSKKNVKATAKQTAKQKKNLPAAIVKAIEAKQGKIKSPAKQDKKDNKVTNTEILKTKSAGGKIKQEILKERGDDYDGSGGYASKASWAKFLKTPEGKAYTARTKEKVGTGKFKEVDDPKPKTKTTSSTETVRVRDTGDSQTALSRRQGIRGGKVGTRVEYQGKIKAAKAKYRNMSKAEKEKVGGRIKYLRKIKNDAKIVRADKNTAFGAAAAKGAKAQLDENKSALSGQTGNVKSASRDQDKGDLTPAQQAAKQAARLEAASNKKANDPKKPSTAFTDNAGDTSTEVKDFSNIKANAKMAPGFFKGKSPLKMGYFKNKK